MLANYQFNNVLGLHSDISHEDLEDVGGSDMKQIDLHLHLLFHLPKILWS